MAATLRSLWAKPSQLAVKLHCCQSSAMDPALTHGCSGKLWPRMSRPHSALSTDVVRSLRCAHGAAKRERKASPTTRGITIHYAGRAASEESIRRLFEDGTAVAKRFGWKARLLPQEALRTEGLIFLPHESCEPLAF